MIDMPSVYADTWSHLEINRWQTTNELRMQMRGKIQPSALINRLQWLQREGLAQSRDAVRVIGGRMQEWRRIA